MDPHGREAPGEIRAVCGKVGGYGQYGKVFGPLGYKPSYAINEVNLLGAGDILLLFTDGLAEHTRADDLGFIPGELEETLRGTKHQSPQAIFEAARERFLSFADPNDDMTLVVIKKR